MSKFQKQNFRLQRIFSDGSKEEPKVYGLEDIDVDWRMGRRGFLITSAIGIGVLSGCIAPKSESTPEPTPENMEGKCAENIRAHTDAVFALSFSLDGKLLASGSGDKTIKLWEMPSGNYLKTLEEYRSDVNAVSFSPDGKLLASGSKDYLLDQTIKLLEMPSGKYLEVLRGHTNFVNAVSFSPDGKLLASGSADQTVKLWKIPSGRLLKILEGHTADVNTVSFSPDGKLFASGSGDQTIKLWEMPSGNLLKTLEGHTENVRAVSFSPDGKLLASGSWDKTVKLWEIPSGKFLTCLFDPATLDHDEKAMKYNSEEGFAYTLPCGSPIPSGAICTCNCVPGTYVAPSVSCVCVGNGGGSYGGGSYCSCNKICTCIPIK